MHLWCPERLEEGIRYPVTGVVNHGESPCGFWGSHAGSLQEQQVI